MSLQINTTYQYECPNCGFLTTPSESNATPPDWLTLRRARSKYALDVGTDASEILIGGKTDPIPLEHNDWCSVECMLQYIENTVRENL